MTFLQYAITCGTCHDCKVVTYPHTDSIPGTSFGKKLMAILTSYNNESVSVKGMVRLIRDVLMRTFLQVPYLTAFCKSQSHEGRSAGNPLKKVILKHDDTRLVLLSSVSASGEDQDIYDYDAQIAWHGTVWTSFMPLPTMVKILEKSTMELMVQDR